MVTPRSTLRNLAAKSMRMCSLAVALLAGAGPSCSESNEASDDRDARRTSCTPGEELCVGTSTGTCNERGTGIEGLFDCGDSGQTCAIRPEDGRAICTELGGSGGSGGSGGATGGAGTGGASAAGGDAGATGGSDPTGGAGATGGSGGAGGSSGGSGATGGSSDSGGTGGATGGSSATGGAGGSTGGSGGSAGSGGPCETGGLFLCDCLPSFGSAVQTLDGAGDEFAGIPAMTFDVSELPYKSPSYMAAISQPVTVRAAWTESAFVAHVHVADPLVSPDAGATLWNGDNVQFFVAGTSILTGSYSGTEDGGATHVIVAPPGSSAAAKAITIYEPCYACVTYSALAPSYFVARTVADGYEIEVSLPWSPYAEPRVSGARFALNFMFGVDNSGGGLELEGAMKNDPSLPSDSCSPTPVTHPGCDDRTWCTPRLE
jgi:hypothetical protein